MAEKQVTRTIHYFLAALAGVLVLASGHAAAQSGGLVRGQVLDPARTSVSGARITASLDGGQPAFASPRGQS
jgi:hypothetical protein